jgi:hypothetical protein
MVLTEMNKTNFSSLFLLILIFSGAHIFAQIETSPLGSNSFVKDKHVPSQKSRAAGDTLSLPFFDDFSYRGPYADASLWLDESVFINNTYPIRPPSIGVATFDGLNSKGEPYGSSTNQAAADTLTSYPIHLNYSPADSIYLSFYYQPKGIGNYPEFVDSLLLEFYNPTDTTWNWAWGTKGEDFPQTLKEFKHVMVPIIDTALLKSGFQFRFRNYAQENGSWDHWHLDYVRLDRNRNRNDTTYQDNSFMYPPSSLLKEYQAVPLWHFMPNSIQNMDTTYALSWTTVATTSSFRFYKYYFKNYSFPEIKRDSINFAPKGPIIPRQELKFTEAVKYVYEDPGTEWTEFQLQHFIVADDVVQDLVPRNDTATYYQVLSNYYALDDGSAEERLNINNNGGGFVAQRFESYIADTLKAIQFYFNKTNETESGSPIFLMIWAAGANQPGELLYSQSEVYPTNDGLNRFVSYELTTPLFLPAGSFYIGWSQTSNYAVNLGFDRNRNNNDRIFYNLSGTWYNYGAQEGTLMMRPLFRYPYDIYVGVPQIVENKDNWQVYPNPASTIVNLQCEGQTKAANILMFDISGRMVLNKTILSEGSIDVSALSNGVYFISIEVEGLKSRSFRKLILSK